MTPLTIAAVAGWPALNCNLLGNASLSRRGGSSASASSGGGGWQIVDRARQKAATEWLDYYPWVMSCTCILDMIATGEDAGGGIEETIGLLESFELPVLGSSPPLPPILTVSGPVPHTELFWVLTKLDFAGGETGQIRDDNGNRTQQGFTIELTEYSPSTAVTSRALSPAQQAALSTGSAAGQTTVSGTTSYTVRGNDTLQSIAVAQLGNVNLWTQIALLNGLSNSALLFPGQILLLPSA